MSKWIIDPVVIYSPSSGETIATAWQKQIKIDDDLLAMINRLRTMDASAGANVSDAEAFQLKINTTDKTLLIRNTTNTEWIVCGYIDKEFLGITPETIHAIKNNGGVNSIKTVQDIPSGGNNGDLALDINNKKLYQKNDGIWSLLLSLSAIDLLDYNNLIKNNDGDIGKISIVNSLPYGGENGDIAIDITNKKMYYRQNNNWNIALSLHASDLVDYNDIILEEDISTTAEANKIPRADDDGKLLNDIAGSPDKLANKTIIADGLKDGMVFVYRSSANDGDGGFVPEGVTASSFIDDTEASISKTYSSLKIENIGINVLKRNKMYNVGDIAYSTKITSTTHLASKLYLECIQEGTTGIEEPILTNINLNDEITDGTAKFKVYDVGLQSLPVGSIYQSTIATSPEELFGGTWEAMPAGRVLLAQGNVETENYTHNFVAGETGGEFVHQLTVGELPKIQPQGTISNTSLTGEFRSLSWSRSSSGIVSSKTTGVQNSLGTGSANNAYVEYTINATHKHTLNINSFGSDIGHNNMQPYLAVYIWKRIN